jgi:signal transduction histidine kinase
MPGMDGIELLKTIKERYPDMEVIMLTGHGDMELAIESLKFQATDFITKPISEVALTVALQRAGERIEMRRQLNAYTQNLEHLVEEKSRQLIEAERLAAVGETVAGLSHTIKNIAGGLDGGMFVLEKGIELEDTAYLNQGWELVRGNVDRIKTLSLDLLNFAKTDRLEYRLVKPEQPAREVFELMRSRAQDQGADLILDIATGLAPIRMDPVGIHQCLLNLVTNAIDAVMDTEPVDRGQRITLSVYASTTGASATGWRIHAVGWTNGPERGCSSGFLPRRASGEQASASCSHEPSSAATTGRSMSPQNPARDLALRSTCRRYPPDLLYTTGSHCHIALGARRR